MNIPPITKSDNDTVIGDSRDHFNFEWVPKGSIAKYDSIARAKNNFYERRYKVYNDSIDSLRILKKKAKLITSLKSVTDDDCDGAGYRITNLSESSNVDIGCTIGLELWFYFYNCDPTQYDDDIKWSSDNSNVSLSPSGQSCSPLLV